MVKRAALNGGPFVILGRSACEVHPLRGFSIIYTEKHYQLREIDPLVLRFTLEGSIKVENANA
jgi:hypothetical protein